MSNSLIELHDSQIGSVAKVGEQVIIFFTHAYLHQSEGRAGWDPGTGWSQAAAMVFAEGSVEGDIPEWPADILEGALSVDEQQLRNAIPVPFEAEGDIALTLSLDSPAELTVRGRRVTLVLIGNPDYMEDFPGTPTT